MDEWVYRELTRTWERGHWRVDRSKKQWRIYSIEGGSVHSVRYKYTLTEAKKFAEALAKAPTEAA